MNETVYTCAKHYAVEQRIIGSEREQTNPLRTLVEPDWGLRTVPARRTTNCVGTIECETLHRDLSLRPERAHDF